MVVDKNSIMQQLKENTSCLEEIKAMMLDIKKEIQEFKDLLKTHKCPLFQASADEGQSQHLKQVSEASVKLPASPSHSLPTSVPEVPPSVSVIIPSQNGSSVSSDPAPLAFHISVPSQTLPSQPSVQTEEPVIVLCHGRSGVEAKSKKEEQAQNDQTFNPAIPLPTEVEFPTGEEDEIVMFRNRAKLYRFVKKEWKDRGVGQLKLLFNTVTKKGRVLMRREQVLKVCANHHITPDINLISMNNHAWMWAANDFADEEVQLEKLCARFKTVHEACEFKRVFENIKRMVDVTPVKSAECSSSTKQESEKKVTSNATGSKNDAVVQPVIETSVPAILRPDVIPAKSSCASGQNFKFENKINNIKNSSEVKQTSAGSGKKSQLFGFTFSSAAKPLLPTPSFPFSEKHIDHSAEQDAEKSKKLANFSYVDVPQIKLSNTSISQQAGESKKYHSSPSGEQGVCVPLFGTNVTNYDYPVGKTVCIAELPSSVVSLPKKVEIKTGEEALQPLYQQQAKLYRFDSNTKQWKERGIGQIKLYYDRMTSRIRLLMRREQVLKVCCNHYVTKEMKFNSMSSSKRAWTWYAQDYSEGKLQAVLFAVKFRTVEQAQDFKAAIDYVQSILKASEAECDSALITNLQQDSSIEKSLIWMCNCLYLNSENLSQCSACKKKKPLQHEGGGDEVSCSSNSHGKLSEGSWNSESCCVENGADRLWCAACKDKNLEKKNPSDDSKVHHLTKVKIVSSCDVSTMCNIEKNAKSTSATKDSPKPTKPQSEKFKVGADIWECEVCYVRNNSCTALLNNVAEDKCIACKNKKPSMANSKFSKLVEPVMETSKPFTDCECKINMFFDVGNKSLLSYCAEDNGISCSSSNTAIPVEKLPKSTNPLWEMFKPCADTWECKMCYVRNSNNAANCVCCGTDPKGPVIAGKQNTETSQSYCDVSSQSCDFQLNSVFDTSQVGHANDVEVELNIKPGVNTRNSTLCVGNNIAGKPFKFSSGTDLPVFHFGVKSSTEEQKVEPEIQIVGEVQATAEEQQQAERLMLPPNFYLYRSKPSCSGCRGCESDTDHEVAPEQHVEESKNSATRSIPQDSSHLNVTTSDTPVETKDASSVTSSVVFSTFATTRVLPDNVVSKVLSEASSASLEASCGVPATQSSYLFSAVQEVSSRTAPSCSEIGKNIQHNILVIGKTAEFTPGGGGSADAGDVGTQTQESAACGCGSSVSVVSSNTTAYVTTIPSVSIFTKVVDSGANTLSSASASVSKHACDSAAAGSTLRKKQTAIPLFSIPNLASFKSDKQSSNKCNPSPTYCIPDLNVNATFYSSPPKRSGNHSKSFLSNTRSSEPCTEDGKTEGGRQQTFSWGGPSTSLLTDLAVSNSSPSFKEADVEENVDKQDGKNSPTPPDPFFKPAIILPDVVEVRTGEEDELRVFGERAKLYRFETTTKEWKERGVGMMKILWHPVKNTFRLLQRREQVYNVVCNHLITTDLELKPIKFSNTALCWGALNHVQEAEPQIEKLAVRFRSPIIKEMFKEIFEECQAKIKKLKLAKGEGGGSQTATTQQMPCKCRPSLLSDLMLHQDGKAVNRDTEANDVEADDEAEDDYDSYGDDSELGVVFEKDDVLLIKKDSGQSVQIGRTRITIEFDDRFHVGHIYALQKDVDNPISDICIDDNCTVMVDGSVCEWKGIDKSAEHRSFSTFSADMMCATDVDDFRNAIELCRKMRQNPEYYSVGPGDI